MKNKPFSAVELFLLGAPRLIKDGTDQTKALKYRKAWALLGYLTAHTAQWQSREKLADLLWPDLDLPAARTNLRQVLSNLSGLLVDADGRSPLERNERAVRWVSGSGIWLDLEFLSNESLARAGSESVAARQWRAHVLQPHVQALSGMFLEGVQISGAFEYEQWQQSAREFYRSRSLLLLEQTCHSHQAQKCLDEAIATARLLLEMEPLDEGYAVRLMELLAGQGRSAEAVAVFEHTKQVMQEQLGVAPGEFLVARYDAVLQTVRKTGKPQAEAVAELRWIAGMYFDFQNQAVLDELEDDTQRARFADTVARFGGKVFPTAGAGTFAVFGLAGVGERVALRALLSAQDLMAWGRPLGLRAGICCGKVLFRSMADGATISGDVSDLAMRICLTAESGQVLLSALAAAQIGRAAAFSEAGEWNFRGLEGCHILQRWVESDVSQAVEMAQGSDTLSGPSSPFFGRSDELLRLMDKWRQSQEHGVQVVVVSAPAGYGKTRLLQEFSRTVEATGAACVQIVFRLETQYQPMAPFLAEMDQKLVTSHNGPGSKSEVFALVNQAIDRRMSEGPSLVLLDDVHWSDLASQEFLPLFVKGLQARKVLLVIATRPGLALDFAQPAEILELKPLSEAQARALARAHQPVDGLPQQQSDWIVATAGGVPLFLELLAKGRPNNQQNLLSIRDVLQSALDQLDDGKMVLRAGAVIGMRFSPAMLGILLGSADLQGALLRAQSLQLINAEADDSYQFHHALIHDAVYESMPLGQRKSMHRLWAAHLQSLPDSPQEEVAYHWEAAHNWIDAAIGWRKAGDAALHREFAADAVASFKRAIHLLKKVDEALRPVHACPEWQLRLGYALHMAEGFGSPAAWHLFKDVARHMDTQDMIDPQNQDMLFAALSGCYMGASSQGEINGLMIAERLSDLARTPTQQLMASFALGNTLFWRGEFAEAIHWQKKGIALSLNLPATARMQYCVDDPAVICRAFLSWSLWFQGDDAQASEMALETLAWANNGKRSHAQCFAFTLLLGLYWCQGKIEELGSLAMQIHLLAKQYGFPLWESVSGLFLLCAQAHSSTMADTTPLFGAARQMQTAYQAGITTSRWIAADALVVLGEWSQALSLLEVSLAEADSHEDQYCVADLLWLRAKCEAATGHAEQSAQSLAQALAVAQRLGAHGLLARYRSATSRPTDTDSGSRRSDQKSNEINSTA